MTEIQPTGMLDYLLQHIVALMDTQSDQVLQEQLGLPLAQYKILRLIGAEDRVQQKVIAQKLGQTEASVSRQVRLMAGRGIIQSLRDPRDKRGRPVVVTPKGEQLLAAATQALDIYYAPTLAALPKKQAKQLHEGLHALHGALCITGHDTAAVL